MVSYHFEIEDRSNIVACEAYFYFKNLYKLKLAPFPYEIM